MRTFGLIGQSLSHSFSYRYFSEKFKAENIADAHYQNFELNAIEEFTALINQQQLSGLNVTIPYKQSIIPFLDVLSKDAKTIGAVNTIAFDKNQLTGYNTDWIGFTKTLPHSNFKKAAILGSGGASKAVQYSLHLLNTEVVVFSRNILEYEMGSYRWLNENLKSFDLVVNCTPLGTAPNTDEKPAIETARLNPSQTVIDLIYNPAKTLLLSEAEKKGCTIINGYKMLVEQAEASWKIWNQRAL